MRALATMRSRRDGGDGDDDDDDYDWSPPADPLPIYQQRYNYLT